MHDLPGSLTPRRLILGLLLGGLLVLSYSVLHLFLVPMAWAAIMAYTTWPLYLRLRRALGERATLSAALMTLLLSLSIALPLLWLVSVLRSELGHAYAAEGHVLFDVPNARWVMTTIATRGERLTLSRILL